VGDDHVKNANRLAGPKGYPVRFHNKTTNK